MCYKFCQKLKRIESSDRVVAMFTTDKLNTKRPHVVCDISKLDTIVTELDPSDALLEEYVKSGASVL